MIIYALVIILQWFYRLVFFLPPRAALYLMHFGSELVYRFVRLTPLKSQCAGNIRLLFPEKTGEKEADRLLRNISYALFEILCLPFFTAEHFRLVCRVNGLENIDLALAKRHGALLLSMHAGNYEFIGHYLPHLGYRLTVPYKGSREPLLKILNRIRQTHGCQIVDVTTENMYHYSINKLAQNELVGILIDTGALEGKHELIPFLGKMIPAASGWLTLAQRAKAPIIPCLTKREGKKLLISFEKPRHLYPDNRQQVVEETITYFESFVKNNPDQWAIFLNGQEVRRMLGK